MCFEVGGAREHLNRRKRKRVSSLVRSVVREWAWTQLWLISGKRDNHATHMENIDVENIKFHGNLLNPTTSSVMILKTFFHSYLKSQHFCIILIASTGKTNTRNICFLLSRYERNFELPEDVASYYNRQGERAFWALLTTFTHNFQGIHHHPIAPWFSFSYHAPSSSGPDLTNNTIKTLISWQNQSSIVYLTINVLISLKIIRFLKS